MNASTLAGANLAGANLAGADLPDADLPGVDLAGGCLREANLLRANLTRADLSNCDLTYATLAGANLECANLESADLAHAHLEFPDWAIETYPPCLVSWAQGETVRLAKVRTLDGEKVAKALQAASVPAAVEGHLGWWFSVRQEDHERAFGILERDAKERGYPIQLFQRSGSKEGEPTLDWIEIGSFEPTREEPRVTNLRGANLVNAFLEGANLTGADLQGARYSTDTRWPQGFDPLRHGAVLVSQPVQG